MQVIDETVLNLPFGVVFFGAVVVPAGGAALVVLQGNWSTLFGQSSVVGTTVSLVGAFLVTARTHLPTNARIAAWSPASPPHEWATVQAHWRRWNHVRTTAAVRSFVLYLDTIASFGS